MTDTHEDAPSLMGLTGPWRKSTFTDQGNCFELAPTAGGVALRNSNHPDAGVLFFTHAELRAFLDGAKAGEFDDLLA